MAALGRSAIYTLIYVPVIMILSFVLAYLLNKGVFWAKGISFPCKRPPKDSGLICTVSGSPV